MSIIVPLNQPTNFEPSQASTQNISVPINLNNYAGSLQYNKTTFIPRVNNTSPSPNPINTAGIPGTNYIGSDLSTGVFYQGEDIIFDTFLFINTQSIDVKRYNLQAIVKSNVYNLVVVWQGSLGNGIYIDDKVPNHFVVFIPNASTDCLIAGSFELDIWAVERVSQLNDIKPRTLLVGKTYFDFQYAAFSPNPESLQGGLNRGTLKPSWPPFVSTTSNADTDFQVIPYI